MEAPGQDRSGGDGSVERGGRVRDRGIALPVLVQSEAGQLGHRTLLRVFVLMVGRAVHSGCPVAFTPVSAGAPELGPPRGHASARQVAVRRHYDAFLDSRACRAASV